jgi:hypothetical protein
VVCWSILLTQSSVPLAASQWSKNRGTTIGPSLPKVVVCNAADWAGVGLIKADDHGVLRNRTSVGSHKQGDWKADARPSGDDIHVAAEMWEEDAWEIFWSKQRGKNTQ